MKFIHYEVMQEVNLGTEEEPKIEKYLHTVSLGPMSDDVFEANYAIAVSEACGEVTVEEVEEEEPAPSIEERVTMLEESNAEMTEALDLILSGVTE